MTQRPLILLLSLVAMAPACSGHSTEEATAECERLRGDIMSCFDDAVMAECVACFEDCGNSCSLVQGMPCTFSCD